jgi:hypothetical protein
MGQDERLRFEVVPEIIVSEIEVTDGLALAWTPLVIGVDSPVDCGIHLDAATEAAFHSSLFKP